MPDSRRDFFRSLVAGGATVTSDLSGLPLKHRRRDKQPNIRLYHGPMLVPPDVAEVLREDPALHRLRGGGHKLAARYADGDGTTWLMRARVPESRAMVGDIVRQSDGHLRVTCWSAARLSPTYRDARELVARNPEHKCAILPPLAPPTPEWELAREPKEN